MIALRSVSASAINKFIACPRQWAKNYDTDTRRRTSGKASDRGILVHAALEMWKKPANNYPKTLEGLEACFDAACLAEGIGESLEVYTTGRAMLKKAFQFTVEHPIMPLDRTTIWAVEYSIDNWLPSPSFPLPIAGYIDTLELVRDRNDPNSYILVVGDYKTGKGKSKEELIDDIQPPLYMAVAVYFLKPYLESQGYKITNVLNVWTYIADEACVVLTQEDYDLPSVMNYIATISRQMMAFADAYNAALKSNTADAFLEKHAKTNPFCGWCPVKGTCEQMQRALADRAIIDPFAPGVTMETLLAERELYALAAREGEERRREIDKIVRYHMNSKRLDSIEANGFIYREVINKDKNINPKAIIEAFGVDFALEHGKITQEAVKNQLAVVKITNPDLHRKIVQFLDENTTETMGARYIRGSRAKKSSE